MAADLAPWLETVGVGRGGTYSVALSAGVLAALLLFALFHLILRAPKGNTILLLGPMGAGKTTLYLQLRDGTKHNGTVTSMQATSETCQLASEKGTKARPIQLVDIPGHPRVRHQSEDFADRTRGVIFVVDSAEFLSQKTDIAEQLYEVLASQVQARRHTPVLLACNKADLGAKAHAPDFIRKRIEKEIEQLRATRQTLGSSPTDVALGSPGEPFSLQALAKVTKIRSSAVSISAADGDISQITEFIRSCVPP